MLKFSRCMLLGVLGAAGLVSFAQAADPFVANPQPKSEPVVKVNTAEVVPGCTSGGACPDGKCSAMTGCGDKERAHGHKLNALGRWLFYRPLYPPGCEGYLPAYRPPLYTWFLCKPGSCTSFAPCGAPTPGAPYIKTMASTAKKIEPPLPKPEMPKIAQHQDQPLLPGSTTAMAEKKDEAVMPPTNYKTLPVSPDAKITPVKAPYTNR